MKGWLKQDRITYWQLVDSWWANRNGWAVKTMCEC